MELYYFSILPTRCKSVRQSSLYSKTMVVIVGLSAPAYSISVTMHPYNFPGTTARDACAPTLKHLPAAKTLSIYIACTHTHHCCELACGCANWLPVPFGIHPWNTRVRKGKRPRPCLPTRMLQPLSTATQQRFMLCLQNETIECYSADAIGLYRALNRGSRALRLGI
jgi:hypothetical protein